MTLHHAILIESLSMGLAHFNIENTILPIFVKVEYADNCMKCLHLDIAPYLYRLFAITGVETQCMSMTYYFCEIMWMRTLYKSLISILFLLSLSTVSTANSKLIAISRVATMGH